MFGRLIKPLHQRLLKAIDNDDDQKLSSLLKSNKLSTQNGTALNELVDHALHSSQPKHLELILANLGAEFCAKQGHWLFNTMTLGNTRLTMLTIMLNAKVPANNHALIDHCFKEVEPNHWLIIISRLVEFGLKIQDHPNAMTLALASNHQNLIHYLVESDVALPTEIPEGCLEEMWRYAKRCQDDKAVRAMLTNS